MRKGRSGEALIPFGEVRGTRLGCTRQDRGNQHAGTINAGIHYQRSHTNSDEDTSILVGYSDDDWGYDMESRRSVTDYILLVNGSSVELGMFMF